MAVVRDVECILQSFMLPTRERPHFCFGHRLASVLACAPFFAVSTSQLLAGPPMFGPKSIIPRMSRLRDKHLGLLQKLASGSTPARPFSFQSSQTTLIAVGFRQHPVLTSDL